MKRDVEDALGPTPLDLVGHRFEDGLGQAWTIHARVGRDAIAAERGRWRPRRFTRGEWPEGPWPDIGDLPNLAEGEMRFIETLSDRLCRGLGCGADDVARRYGMTERESALCLKDFDELGQPFALFPARRNPLLAAAMSRGIERYAASGDRRAAWRSIGAECARLRYRPPSPSTFAKLVDRSRRRAAARRDAEGGTTEMARCA